MESGIFCFGDLYIARRDSISRYDVVNRYRIREKLRGAFGFQGLSSESQTHQSVLQAAGEKMDDMANEMDRHLRDTEECSFWRKCIF